MSRFWQFFDSQMAIFRRVRPVYPIFCVMAGDHIWPQSGTNWLQMGQIRAFVRPDVSDFDSVIQNVLKSGLKKYQICPNSGQSDPYCTLCYKTWTSIYVWQNSRDYLVNNVEFLIVPFLKLNSSLYKLEGLLRENEVGRVCFTLLLR